MFYFLFVGFSVMHRKRNKSKVGSKHLLTKEDAIKWFQRKYDGIILNDKNK